MTLNGLKKTWYQYGPVRAGCASMSWLMFCFIEMGTHSRDAILLTLFQRCPQRILDFKHLVQEFVLLLVSGLRRETSGTLTIWSLRFIYFFAMGLGWGSIYPLESFWKQGRFVAFNVRNVCGVFLFVCLGGYTQARRRMCGWYVTLPQQRFRISTSVIPTSIYYIYMYIYIYHSVNILCTVPLIFYTISQYIN